MHRGAGPTQRSDRANVLSGEELRAAWQHRFVPASLHSSGVWVSRLKRAFPARAAMVGAVVGMGVSLVGAAPRGGGEQGVLRLSVSTNSMATVGVRVRTGQQVSRTYRMRNFAEYGLKAVKLTDPQVPGGFVPCPHTAIPPLGVMVCRASMPALTGRRVERVVATGVATWEEYGTARASASAGYEGLASSLALERTASQKRLTYRVSYSGPADLENVQLQDPMLASSQLRCGAGLPVPSRLPSGTQLECWGPAPEQPGRHESVARVSGTTSDRAVSESGTSLPALALSAQAAAGYTVPEPAATPPRAGLPPPNAPPRSRPRRPVPKRTSSADRAPHGPSADRRPPSLANGVAPGPVGQGVGGTGRMFTVPGNAAPTLGAAARGAGGAFAVPGGGAPPPPAAPATVVGGTAGLVAVPGDVPLPPATATGDTAGLVTVPGDVPPPSGTAVPGERPPPSAPADAFVAGRRVQQPANSLEDSVDWAFITLMVVLFPALLTAVTVASQKSKSRDR